MDTTATSTDSKLVPTREQLTTRRLSDGLRSKPLKAAAAEKPDVTAAKKDTLNVETRPKRPSLEEADEKDAKKPRLPVGDFKTPDKIMREGTKASEPVADSIVARPQARRPLSTQATHQSSLKTDQLAKPTVTVPKVSPAKAATLAAGPSTLSDRISSSSAFKKPQKETNARSDSVANAAKLKLSRSKKTAD